MRGFTVLELVVVAAIVVTGSFLAFQTMRQQQSGTAFVQRRAELEELRETLRLKLSCDKTTEPIIGACPTGYITLKDLSGKTILDNSGTGKIANFVARATCSGNRVKQIGLEYKNGNRWDNAFPVVPMICSSKPDADFSNCLGQKIAIQSDGKILVAASCVRGVIYNDPYLIRFNADGTLDSAFGTNGSIGVNLSTTSLGNQVDTKSRWIGINATGQIYVLVTFPNKSLVYKVSSAGALDASFGTSGIAPLSADAVTAFDLGGLRNDGKFWLASSNMEWGTNIPPKRYNPNGSLDYAIPFTPAVNGRAVDVTYMALEAAANQLFTFNSLALVDSRTSFYCNVITNVSPGSYTFTCPAPQDPPTQMYGIGVTRYNAAGAVDNGFGQNGYRGISNAFDSNYFKPGPIAGVPWLGRYRMRGFLFEPGNKATFIAVLNQGFPASIPEPTVHTGVYRFATNTGLFDPTFGTNGKYKVPYPNAGGTDFPQWGIAIVKQSTGRYVMLGSGPSCGPCFHLMGVNSSGSLDGTYGSGGVSFFSGYDMFDAQNDSTNRTLVTGSKNYNGGLALIRFNADGSEDTTYASRKGR